MEARRSSGKPSKVLRQSSARYKSNQVAHRSSETGIPVPRLIKVVEEDKDLIVQVCWKGLPESEDTLIPLRLVFEDVSQMLRRLLERKNLQSNVARQARRALGL